MGRGNKETLWTTCQKSLHIHVEEVRLGAKVLLGDRDGIRELRSLSGGKTSVAQEICNL